jgi:hypothetical protein
MPFAVTDPAAVTKELREHQTKANTSQKGLAGEVVASELKASVENDAALHARRRVGTYSATWRLRSKFSRGWMDT